jgi:hypothetical protein
MVVAQVGVGGWCAALARHALSLAAQIPKWTRAKFEVSTAEAGNPIKQDVTKQGQPRSVRFVRLSGRRAG